VSFSNDGTIIADWLRVRRRSGLGLSVDIVLLMVAELKWNCLR